MAVGDGLFQPELSLKIQGESWQSVVYRGLGPEQCTKEMTALRGIPGSTRGSHWIRCCGIVYKTYGREPLKSELSV